MLDDLHRSLTTKYPFMDIAMRAGVVFIYPRGSGQPLLKIIKKRPDCWSCSKKNFKSVSAAVDWVAQNWSSVKRI